MFCVEGFHFSLLCNVVLSLLFRSVNANDIIVNFSSVVVRRDICFLNKAKCLLYANLLSAKQCSDTLHGAYFVVPKIALQSIKNKIITQMGASASLTGKGLCMV